FLHGMFTSDLFILSLHVALPISCLCIWIWFALSVLIADRHRDVSGALLCSFGRPCSHNGRLSDEGSDIGLFHSQYSRLWLKRDRHRIAPAHQPNVSLRSVQGTPKTAVADRKSTR